LTLTKDGIAEQNFPVQQAKDSLEMILEEIKSSLESGSDVKISGFGKWAVKHKKTRRGRNPHTGAQIEVTARTVVTFHPSDKLRDSVISSWKQS